MYIYLKPSSTQMFFFVMIIRYDIVKNFYGSFYDLILYFI